MRLSTADSTSPEILLPQPPHRIAGTSPPSGAGSAIGGRLVNLSIHARSMRSLSQRVSRPFHTKGP